MGRTIALPRNFRAQLEREVREAWDRPYVKTARDVEHELENTHLGLLEMYRDACPIDAHRHRYYQRHRPTEEPPVLGDDEVDQMLDSMPSELRILEEQSRDADRRSVRALMDSVRLGKYVPGAIASREIEKAVLVAAVAGQFPPISRVRQALERVSADLARPIVDRVLQLQGWTPELVRAAVGTNSSP